MPIRIPPIQEFPKDGRTWRIDWLGAVERSIPEALIEVFLSPVKKGIRWPRDQKHFEAEPLKVRIGVGQLPFLSVGSLWRDGERTERFAGYPVELELRVCSRTVRVIDAGEKLAEGRWVVPPFAHRLPNFTLGSRCMAIDYQGDPYGVILPMAEAIRFYYAVSTDLAHVAFSGAFGLDRGTIIDPSSSGMLQDTDRMVLRLRQWLADDDGWVIGRLLADGRAEEGMARIYDSIVRSSANGKAAYPECALPFEGNALWRMRGVPLASRDNATTRWLIFELRSCSAPFPFGELEIVRDNDGRRADPETDLSDEEKQPAWSAPLKEPVLAAGSELQSQEPPESNVGAMKVPLAGERFESLIGKEIIKTEKDQCQYTGASFRDSMTATALGTGEQSSAGNGVAPARAEWQRDVEIQRRKALPASFEALEAVVDALNEMSGVTARLREDASDIAYLPRTKPARMQQWSYLNFASKTWRRVMVVDISCHGRHASFVEFEQRGSERCTAALLMAPDQSEITNSALVVLLRRLVRARGVWSNVHSLSELSLAQFKHTRPSAAAFAEVIVQAILQR